MNCCLTPLNKSTQISDSSVDSLKYLVRELGVTDYGEPSNLYPECTAIIIMLVVPPADWIILSF